MNISYLIRYLWKKKWFIVLPTFAAVVAAWYFSIHKSHTYTSVAELSTGFFMEANPLDDNRYPNNTVLFNNVMQTLQSNQVLDQVTYILLTHDISGTAPYRTPANQERSAELQKSYPGGKAGLLVSLNNKADSFYVLNLAKQDDRKIAELAGLYGYSPESLLSNVQIKRIEGSDFIDIIAQTDNPELSAVIANTICRTFLEFYQTRTGRASSVSLDTLKSIMDAKKQLLDNKLKLLQAADLSGANNTGLLSTLQGQLSQQRANLIQAQAALDNDNLQITASGKKGGGLANNEDIIDLRANIDNLYAKYVNGGSTDAALLDQINKLRSDYQKKLNAAGNTEAGIPMNELLKQKMTDQVQVNVANQTIKELQNQINQLSSAAQSSTSQAGLVQSLQSEVEIARQDYSNSNTLYNNALNRNIFPGNNFRQTLIASPSLSPDPSKKIKVIGLTGAGVFFVLVFLFLFMEFIDTSIKAPSFLKENVPLPLLANLQRIDMKKLTVEGIFSANGSLSQRKCGFRDQVKQLRYEVENSGKKIFIMASYYSGSGSTTLIRALASSLSLNNRKILLIDANFKHNTLSQQYNTQAFLESFDANGENNLLKEKLAGITTATEDENIAIIGCEKGSHTPEELLPEKNLFTYLNANETGYDYVFIDCAALSKGPDCKELLRYAEAVILIFAADRELNEESKKFAEFLKKKDIQVLGMVLNRINSYNMDM